MGDLRAALSDKMIEKLPFANGGQYVVRDTDLRGFHLVVGVRRKTFGVQAEHWKNGQRRSHKMTLGYAGDM